MENLSQHRSEPNSYEDVARPLPSLAVELERIKSVHDVYYGRNSEPSAAEIVRRRRSMNPSDPARRSSDALVQKIFFIDSLLESNQEYTSYYTEVEIIELSNRLCEAHKNFEDENYLRALYDELEPTAQLKVLYAERNEFGVYIKHQDEEDNGTNKVVNYTLFEHEQDERIYPSWDSQEDAPPLIEAVSEMAQKVSDNTRHFLLAGFNRNLHRHKYLLNLTCPEYGDVQATQRYLIMKYVADNFAADVVAKRVSRSDVKLRELCLRSTEAIDSWMQANGDLIDALPRGFTVTEKMKIRKSPIDFRTQGLSAKDKLETLVSIMHARINSTETQGPLCSFNADISSFYSLQRKIAYFVSLIIRQLPEYKPEEPLSVKPIEPLS